MRLVLPLLLGGCTPDAEPPTDTSGEVCDALGLSSLPFDATAEPSTGRGALAADVQLATTAGPWRLSEAWSGCDVFVFVPDEDASSAAFPGTLWDRDLADLLDRSPLNVHWIFFSNADDAPTRVADVEAEMSAILDGLAPTRADWWRDRLHYVSKPASDIASWPMNHFRRTGYGFAIDRSQRIRDIGSLADPDRYDAGAQWYAPNVSFAANEAIYLNFLADRDAERAAVQDQITRVRLLDGETVGQATLDVDLPDASTMQRFDTLELDLEQLCGESPREFGTCPAWDYLAHLYVCGIPTDEPDPDADTPCQPRVPGTAEQIEVLGTCHADGAPTSDTCRAVDDCPPDSGLGLTCEGYVAPRAAVPEIPADTLSCRCDTPGLGQEDLVQTCNAEGTGYAACPCSCQELGRWITTYHREGRWVHEASAGLAWLADGGRHRFRYQGGNTYDVTLDLLFSDRRPDDVGAPDKMIPLFQGGSFGAAYNDAYEPLEVDIPADAKAVELVATITGHGFGRDEDNCAEFCNHTHHFTIGATEFVKEHPWADEPFGCMDQVADGTVPNQFGTWFFGRGGWCPGKEVRPFVVDVTDAAPPGRTVTVSYEGRLRGEPYVPRPANNGGFGANIRMVSHLLIRR